MSVKSINITSEFEKITHAAKEVCNFLSENGIEKSLQTGIEMCLVEALNNIVEHAYKCEPDNPIRISVSSEENKIKIELVDNGIPRTNFDTPKLEFDPDDIESLPEGGMGLFIIDQLMDETEYRHENGENIFKMTKILNDHY